MVQQYLSDLNVLPSLNQPESPAMDTRFCSLLLCPHSSAGAVVILPAGTPGPHTPA